MPKRRTEGPCRQTRHEALPALSAQQQQKAAREARWREEEKARLKARLKDRLRARLKAAEKAEKQAAAKKAKQVAVEEMDLLYQSPKLKASFRRYWKPPHQRDL